jgi:hypothetical protein
MISSDAVAVETVVVGNKEDQMTDKDDTHPSPKLKTKWDTPGLTARRGRSFTTRYTVDKIKFQIAQYNSNQRPVSLPKLKFLERP